MKAIRTLTFSTILLAFVIAGCRKDTPNLPEETASLTNAPVLPERTPDYVRSQNDSMAELGRVLFYDKNLSLNNSVSCGSCHQQSRAFCDNLQFSVGLEDLKTRRNSPSIFAKNGRMFWDGRAANMEELVFMPVQNHVEMKFADISELTKKIARIDYYRPLFKKVFSTDYIETGHVQKAMAEFLRNFDFSRNKFSRSNAGTEKLSASEANGRDIFFGKGRCANCHQVNNPAGSNGYYSSPSISSFNIGLDYVYSDKGVGEISLKPEDEGKFFIPPLLNVEYTAPYMHDGRHKTLQDVIEHYNSGIKDNDNLDPQLRDLSSLGNISQQERVQLLDKNGNGTIDAAEVKDFPPVRLGLNDNEKRNLVDFLKTMSDPSILNDSKFSNPFSKIN